jgi:hypothetical protein
MAIHPCTFALLLTIPLGAADGFVSLMPHRDIAEHWTAQLAPASIWRVQGNEIVCTGRPNGFLRSRRSFRNFIFRAEWRFKKEGWVPKPEDEGWPNAGFFINAHEIVDGWPRSLEVQGHFGEAGSLFGVRGGDIRGARRGPIVKERPPFGAWDRYEVTSVRGHVTVLLNGKQVNEGWHATPADGNLCLQSEGWEVHYRKVAVKELP